MRVRLLYCTHVWSILIRVNNENTQSYNFVYKILGTFRNWEVIVLKAEGDKAKISMSNHMNQWRIGQYFSCTRYALPTCLPLLGNHFSPRTYFCFVLHILWLLGQIQSIIIYRMYIPERNAWVKPTQTACIFLKYRILAVHIISQYVIRQFPKL